MGIGALSRANGYLAIRSRGRAAENPADPTKPKRWKFRASMRSRLIRTAGEVARRRTGGIGGQWYKRFSGMTVCGEGELIKIFLLKGQAPKGQHVP